MHTHFGDYEILEEMGHGGMGVVYRARQKSLSRLVALKLLLFGVHAPPELVKRFRAEAVATAALQHPNIVPIHEVGFCEGQHFIAMDYIEGRSLASLIRVNPLPARRAAGYLKTIAEAVHYAHERGILHRDLKPANVLIDTNDQPHVTDFGLAKRLDDDSELTVTGQMVGSPNYMPPEQAAGKRRTASRRTDVYALGATLYHALTGRPPFVGEGLADTVQQVLHVEPLSPRVLKPSVPADLETICLKCLEKEPSKRYATAQLLAEELGRFLEGKPVLARPVSRTGKAWRWCRRSPVLAGLTAGLVAAFALGTGGVVFEWARAERHARDAERHAQEESRQRLRAEQNTYAADMKAAQIEIQRMNWSLARALLRQYLPQTGNGHLRTIEWRYLWQQCQPDAHLTLPHPEPVGDVAFSPDRQLLATVTWGVDWKTRVWDLRTTNLIRAFPGGGTEAPKRSLAFSPDGKWLVLRGPNGFEIRATDDWRPLRNFDAHPGSPSSLSADGRVLVICGTNGLQAWDLVSGTCRRTNTFASNNNLGISADGRRIICSKAVPHFGTYLWPTILWDLDHDTSITLPVNTDVASLAITSNGVWAASGHFMGELKLWNLDTEESIALEAEILGRAHRFAVLCLAFSPDGKRLASAGCDEVVRIWETESGKLLRTLRWHSDSVWNVAFSSDGEHLASASADGKARIWNLQVPQLAAVASRTMVLPTNAVPVGCLTNSGRLVSWNSDARVAHINDLSDALFSASVRLDSPELAECSRILLFPKCDRALGVTSNGVVHLGELITGKHLRTVELGATNFDPDHLSPDGRWLLGDQQTLALYDLHTARRVPEFSFSWLWYYGAAFSPDGRWLVISHQSSGIAGDGTVHNQNRGTTGVISTWDLHRGRVAHTFGESQTQIISLAFSPNGQVLASGGLDRAVRLWSFPAGISLHPPLEGHLAYIAQVAFSADGKTLASIGSDGLRLWNVAAGRETLVLEHAMMAAGIPRFFSHSFYAAQAEFNPLDRFFIWQEFEGPIRIATLPTLEEIDRQAIITAGR